MGCGFLRSAWRRVRWGGSLGSDPWNWHGMLQWRRGSEGHGKEGCGRWGSTWPSEEKRGSCCMDEYREKQGIRWPWSHGLWKDARFTFSKKHVLPWLIAWRTWRTQAHLSREFSMTVLSFWDECSWLTRSVQKLKEHSAKLSDHGGCIWINITQAPGLKMSWRQGPCHSHSCVSQETTCGDKLTCSNNQINIIFLKCANNGSRVIEGTWCLRKIC